MKIKKMLCGFLGLISVGLLSGCDDSNVSINTTVDSDTSNQSDEINIVKNDNLAIDQNKCVGCGKCARMASSNFEMNSVTHKAQVKSKEIANQVAVDRAIAVCHPRAITQ